VAAFGLGCFFVTRAPTSGVGPAPDVIVEHRMYMALWSDVVQKSPGKSRPRLNYGHALAQRGDFERAPAEFRRALELSGAGPPTRRAFTTTWPSLSSS
jgi:hypothetical protein